MSRPDRFSDDLLKSARQHSINHRAEVEASDLVGCFHCRKSYEASLITEWVNGEETALCRRCGIDAVVPGAAGFPVGDRNFLTALHRIWF